MKYNVLIGRILFSLIFIMAAFGHFPKESIAYASMSGVPAANVLVPLSGIISLLGGLSVLLGYKAKWGAWALIIFLLPVSFMMHNFWAATDPMQKQMHMAMFMKNMGLVGGALLITYFGAGPLSIDSRTAAKKAVL